MNIFVKFICALSLISCGNENAKKYHSFEVKAGKFSKLQEKAHSRALDLCSGRYTLLREKIRSNSLGIYRGNYYISCGR